jgi:tRNA threonylcarbamoyladenosine biosynthesis protein TsaB
MRVLALDTATEACSVALHTDTGMVSRFEEVGRGHAESILAMVDAVLSEAGLALGLLDGIAASVGPGAFTGVRISVSVAQGLAFGAGIPVVGVTTLEALALAAMRGGAARALPCLDARMGEVYWGVFAADAAHGLVEAGISRVSAPQAVAQDAAGPCHGVGRGYAAYPELRRLPDLILSPGADRVLPDARQMAYLGAIRLARGLGHDPAELKPVYLRDKVAFTELERVTAKPPS